MMDKSLPQHLDAQLKALREMRDEDIDFSDIAEITDFSGFRGINDKWVRRNWHVMEIDREIVDWFRDHAQPGEDWREGAKNVLREFVSRAARKAA